ncbi:MAG: tetratricopeptide repeat protein [Bacteroidales bacterium]|nr:tetratricopeptide repeat protein [Bacteroidales bacterium]
MKKIALIMLTICQFGFLYSQEEWEYMNISSWTWSVNEKLKYSSKSTSKLDVWNDVAETDEDRRNNKWTSWNAWMNCQNIGNRPCLVTFNIKQDHNPRTHKFKTYKPNGTMVWYNENSNQNVYWGVVIQAANKFGGESEYTINYSDEHHYNSSYTYTSSWDTDTKKWQCCTDRDERQFKIVYDGISSVQIYNYDGNHLAKTFTNVNGISWIGVKVGTAANVVVTDFKVLRMTDYGLAKPQIEKARECFQNSNYSDAITIISRVLNNYKAAFPYYLRGLAYAQQSMHKAAIDDFTTALSYSCDLENRRDIYYYRGIERLIVKDVDNGVSDLRIAGEQGMATLKQLNLENYQPGQHRSSVISGSGTPPLKKNGNTSSSSSPGTPILRKTK